MDENIQHYPHIRPQFQGMTIRKNHPQQAVEQASKFRGPMVDDSITVHHTDIPL